MRCSASRVSPQDARKLSQPLLLLAVERTIPAGLKTLVRSMLNLLWPLCLEDGDMVSITSLVDTMCDNPAHVYRLKLNSRVK